MTAPAIVMMVITILLVWGGLVASVVALRGVNATHSGEDTHLDSVEDTSAPSA